MGVRLCGPVLRFSRKVWGGGRAPVGTLTVLVPQLLDACFDVILGGRHREVLALDPTPRRGALAGAKCGSTDRNIGAISSLACGVSASPCAVRVVSTQTRSRHETSYKPFFGALFTVKPVCVLLKFSV